MRIEKGYTQNELAIMLGLKISTLQKYESGTIQNLKLETIRELCHIFEVPPIVFVFPNLTKEEKKIFESYILHSQLQINKAGAKRLVEYYEELKQIDKYKL